MSHYWQNPVGKKGGICPLDDNGRVPAKYMVGGSWSFADNADNAHPAEISFDLSPGVTDILLTCWTKAFRAYATGAASGGGSTSGSGGGQTSGGGGGGTSGYTGVAHTHTIDHSHTFYPMVQCDHYHTTANHTHGIEFSTTQTGNTSGHTHDYSKSWASTDSGGSAATGGPSHMNDSTVYGYSLSSASGDNSHAHTTDYHSHSVAAHTHTTPDHIHNVTYGIYEYTQGGAKRYAPLIGYANDPNFGISIAPFGTQGTVDAPLQVSDLSIYSIYNERAPTPVAGTLSPGTNTIYLQPQVTAVKNPNGLCRIGFSIEVSYT